MLASFGAKHNIDVANFALLMLRVGVGGMIIAHGMNHLVGGGRIAGTSGWFESLGMRPGRRNAYAATVTELGSGTLLCLGLLTPVGAAGVIGLMVVAIVAAHWKNGYFVFKPGQGIEYCLTVAVVAAVIGAMGPGRWSLDYAIGFWHHSRLLGLVVAVGLGVAAATAQLALVWRPGSVAAR